MPIDFENDQTMTDAMARLNEAEASEPAPTPEKFVQTDDPAPSVEGDPKPEGETPTDSPAGTPADAKPPVEDTVNPVKKDAKSDLTRKGNGQFANDAVRRDKSWKALNAEKEAFTKEREALATQKTQLEQQQQQFQQRQAKANNRFTPEQYEQAATNKANEAEQLLLQADGVDRRADKLEEAGKAGEAELERRKASDLREQATGNKHIAKQYKQFAEHARKNPDPTAAQVAQQNQQKIQAYTIEAAKQWPQLAVKDSPFQQAMVRILGEARKAGLDENENPALRYHAARLVAAELASARVPDLEKKLGAAQARVKELEAFTAPGGGVGSVQTPSNKSFEELSEAEQEAQLRSQAAQL